MNFWKNTMPEWFLRNRNKSNSGQVKPAWSDSLLFFLTRGELWVKGIHIAEYKLGTYYNHEEKRERKLLLTHKELVKLERKVKETGLTIIPVKIFLSEKGYAKLRIALAKGKKNTINGNPSN